MTTWWWERALRGCVLARRLTEDPEVRVLLLEAGGADWDPLIHIPLGPERSGKNACTTGLRQRAEPNLNQRSIEVLRGKVLGGSSSINFMAHIRGTAAITTGGRAPLLPVGRIRICCPISSGPRPGRTAPRPTGARTARSAWAIPTGPILSRAPSWRPRAPPAFRSTDDVKQRRGRGFRPVAVDDCPRTPGKRRGRLSASVRGAGT